MAQLGGSFDPNSVPEDILPEKTKFLAQVINSELTPTKDGTGQRLILTWEIVGGPFAKKQVFHGINYRNKNPQAEAIAARELAEVCKAMGLGPISDSNQLHMRPCVVRFKTERADGFAPKSVPTGFERWDNAPVGDPAPGAMAAPAAPRGPTTTVTPAAQQQPAPAAQLPADANSPWG